MDVLSSDRCKGEKSICLDSRHSVFEGQKRRGLVKTRSRRFDKLLVLSRNWLISIYVYTFPHQSHGGIQWYNVDFPISLIIPAETYGVVRVAWPTVLQQRAA